MLCNTVRTCDSDGGLLYCIERAGHPGGHALMCRTCPSIGNRTVRA